MRHQEQIEKELSRPASITLFRLLRSFEAIEIETLFYFTFPNSEHIDTRRKKQQYLGGVIAHINQVLGRHDYKVVPGTPRGTYHIISTLSP